MLYLYVIFILHPCLHAAKLLVDKNNAHNEEGVYAFIKRKNIMAAAVAQRLDSSLIVHHAHQQSDRQFLNLKLQTDELWADTQHYMRDE